MPGAALNLVLPASGDTWPTWGNRVLQCLTDIKNDLEPQIVSSEININANLDFNNKSPTNAAYYGCNLGGTATIPVNSIGIKNGEWFATDAAGNSVQLTLNGAVNVTTSGAITGTGYGTGGVELNWNSAIPTYSFFSAASTYADVRMNDLKLRNGTTAELTVTWGGASNLTWTLPGTAATGVSLLTLSSGGAVAHNAAVTTGITFSSANITLSGTADIKHPDYEGTTRAALSHYFTTVSTTTADVGYIQTTVAATSFYAADARVTQVGNRLKSVSVLCDKGDASSTTITVYKMAQREPTLPASIASATDSVSGTNRIITATVGSPTAQAAGESVIVRVQFTTAVTNTVYSVKFVWDRT